jgi:hypothetical protein
MDGFGVLRAFEMGPCYRVRWEEKFLSDQVFGLNIQA